jgi:DNA polymerase-3 subunit alpha
MGALALTDHRTLIGAVDFYEACQKRGVQPILGLEFEVGLPPDLISIPQRGGRMVLLALDLSGWASLCHLSSVLQTDLPLANDQGLPFERLREFAEGVICLTGGRRGLINGCVREGRDETAKSILQRLNDYFLDRLYVELQKHTSRDDLLVDRQLDLARRLNLPVVATTPRPISTAAVLVRTSPTWWPWSTTCSAAAAPVWWRVHREVRCDLVLLLAAAPPVTIDTRRLSSYCVLQPGD